MFWGSNLLNIKTYVVTSGSMIPRYPIGSLIYVRKVDPEKIKIGDSITFNMKNSSIIATHEVYKIDIKKKLFYTQGINNKNDQGKIIHDAESVPFNSLIGKPVLCIPYLGYLNRIITRKPGSYILIIIALATIIISISSKQRKE